MQDIPLPIPGREPCIANLQPPGCSVENGKALVENLLTQNRILKSMIETAHSYRGGGDSFDVLKVNLHQLELKVASILGAQLSASAVFPVSPTTTVPVTPDRYKEKYEEMKEKYKECKSKLEDVAERAKSELEKCRVDITEKNEKIRSLSAATPATVSLLEKVDTAIFPTTKKPEAPSADLLEQLESKTKECADLKEKLDAAEKQLQQLQQSKPSDEDCEKFKKQVEIVKQWAKGQLEQASKTNAAVIQEWKEKLDASEKECVELTKELAQQRDKCQQALKFCTEQAKGLGLAPPILPPPPPPIAPVVEESAEEALPTPEKAVESIQIEEGDISKTNLKKRIVGNLDTLLQKLTDITIGVKVADKDGQTGTLYSSLQKQLDVAKEMSTEGENLTNKEGVKLEYSYLRNSVVDAAKPKEAFSFLCKNLVGSLKGDLEKLVRNYCK